MILDHRNVLEENGNLEIKRTSQNVEWLEESIQSLLQLQFRQHPEVLQSFKEIEDQVRSGTLAGNAAARMLMGKIN